MPKLKDQIDRERMQRTLSVALIRRGFNPKSLGKDLGERLGKTAPTGRKLLKDPYLLTVGEIVSLRLSKEEIAELFGGNL